MHSGDREGLTCIVGFCRDEIRLLLHGGRLQYDLFVLTNSYIGTYIVVASTIRKGCYECRETVRLNREREYAWNKLVLLIFYKKYFKDVSREFDEFQVNTHLWKLRCWYL